MTIVKRSFKSKSKSQKSHKALNSDSVVDVFSESHLPGISTNKKIKAVYESDSSYDDVEEEESQAPKEELQDLFAAIQSRLRKKTIDQKKAMENELRKTISRTVDEMNQKIELAKGHIDTKLLEMKLELEKIQKEREVHLKTIKSDYEKFQTIIQKSIDKIDYGEKRIHEMREKFLSEIISFNRDFNFPKERIQELFNSAVNERKRSSTMFS